MYPDMGVRLAEMLHLIHTFHFEYYFWFLFSIISLLNANFVRIHEDIFAPLRNCANYSD